MKNGCMMDRRYGKCGYDWWWHSLTGKNKKTGIEKAFFIEYYIVNPTLHSEITYGEDGKNKPCYFMIKAGAWGENKKQLHRYYNPKDITIDNKVFEVYGEDFYLSNTKLKGSINVEKETYFSDYGTMRWDLTCKKVIPFDVGYGTSKLLRFLHAFEMYWHAEGIKTLYEGTIVYDGEEYIVNEEGSFGYQDKNFGSNFTSPWVWLSSCDILNQNNIRLTNSAFDIGGGRPKVFKIPFNNIILVYANIEGKIYEYNFSKFWHPSKTSFDCYEDEDTIYWNIRAKNRKSEMIVQITCEKKDMLFIRYEDPHGKQNYRRLFNGGTGKGTMKIYNKKNELIEDLIVGHVGCEYGRYFFQNDDYRK